MHSWILLASLLAVTGEGRAERRPPPHVCGEDELLARLQKRGGDVVDRLLVTPQEGECADGPANPIEALTAEVVCASSSKVLAARLRKVERRLGISAAVVSQCGDRPEVSRWALELASAALRIPARRDEGLERARPLAQSGAGAPLLDPLLDALDDELAHPGPSPRVPAILGVLRALAPAAPSSPRLLASLEAVLVASDGDLAHLDLATKAVGAMADIHSTSPTSREHIIALVKRLMDPSSKGVDLSTARSLLVSALNIDRSLTASVTEFIVSAASTSPRACATPVVLVALALLPDRMRSSPAIVGCIRSTLRDADQPVYVRHDAAALVRLALRQDLHGDAPPFGLEDLMVVHAVETHEELSNELPRPTSTLDRLNICRLEAGLPSLNEADVGEPSTVLRAEADDAARCMEVRVCAPGRAAYATVLKACCAATPVGSVPRSWCTSP